MNRLADREGLARAFRARFGRAPAVIVRAPGRVNLIGEHTDYNGLPVLPMAIERATWIAAAPRADGHVGLTNADATFGAREFALAESIPPFPGGDWGNYAKAAVQGVIDALGRDAVPGGDLLVASDLPRGAGLSSSSALVVGSALAWMHLAGRELSRLALAELAATAEQYVGTMSGGMDQAVCLLAEPAAALRIDFFPLRVRPVAVPAGAAFVVCDSLVPAEKAGRARAAYNRRVIECRLACAVLEALAGDELDGPLTRLAQLGVHLLPGTLEAFLANVEAVVPDGALDLDTVARLARRDVRALAGADPGPFVLRRRIRHVLSEARRVDCAEQALVEADLDWLGRLMDASHASCRDDYEVSCPELEALVAAARDAGALGSRLTGAGFGGCTVSLVPSAAVDAFRGAVGERYYASHPGPPPIWTFAPAPGAQVWGT